MAAGALEHHAMTTLQAYAVGSPGLLTRPCVDCGLITGCYCDLCFAEDRMPDEAWVEAQLTPLCTKCDGVHGMCHYCRGDAWCAPAPHR